MRARRHGKTKCQNTFNGYECVCGPGYVSQVTKDGKLRCLNVNECKTLDAADLGRDCTCDRCACQDVPGSYKCAPALEGVGPSSHFQCLPRRRCPLSWAASCTRKRCACQGIPGSYKCAAPLRAVRRQEAGVRWLECRLLDSIAMPAASSPACLEMIIACKLGAGYRAFREREHGRAHTHEY